MLSPDADARRMLVREHQAELAHDALRADEPWPEVMASRTRGRRRRLHLPRFRFQVRPARGGS